MQFWSGIAGALALACSTALAALLIAGDDSATTRSVPTSGLEVFLNPVARNDTASVGPWPARTEIRVPDTITSEELSFGLRYEASFR